MAQSPSAFPVEEGNIRMPAGSAKRSAPLDPGFIAVQRRANSSTQMLQTDEQNIQA